MTETGDVVEVKKDQSGPVFLSEGVTVKELSEKMPDVKSRDVMKALITRGVMATVNQSLDPKLAIEVAKEFGYEAQIQSFEDEATPLQKKLEHLGKVLGTACLAICAVVFVYGVFRDTNIAAVLDTGLLHYLEAERKGIINLFMTAVSLAIAAVPEGLPAIVTICLALGMQRMIKHHALIRKLPAVETLGCATVVCSDKTGTLTQNEMTVVEGWAGGKRFKVTGEGYNPQGRFFLGHAPFDPRSDADATVLLHGAMACNDAKLDELTDDAGERSWQIVGDPTEGAIRYGGVDLRDMDPRDLRSRIGAVFQDFVRYQFTAAENVGLGEPAHVEDRPRIEEAARRGGAAGVIEGLPQRYDTVLGGWFERGHEISAGQWQKLAVARAFMREAEVLILDEPTASIDAESEHELFQHFQALAADRTAIVISHRFSTVRIADRIAVLHGGRLEELGSHHQLIEAGGRYAHLFQLQAQGYLD